MAATTERCTGFEPHPYAGDEYCVATIYVDGRPRYCRQPRSEHVAAPARSATSALPLGHAFVPAPFYPAQCDVKVDDHGRVRTCARPAAEHT